MHMTHLVNDTSRTVLFLQVVFSTATILAASIPHVTTPDMIQPNVPVSRGITTESTASKTTTASTTTASTTTATASLIFASASTSEVSTSSSATESYCTQFKEVNMTATGLFFRRIMPLFLPLFLQPISFSYDNAVDPMSMTSTSWAFIYNPSSNGGPFCLAFHEFRVRVGFKVSYGFWIRVRVGFKVVVSVGDLWRINKVDIKKQTTFLLIYCKFCPSSFHRNLAFLTP